MSTASVAIPNVLRRVSLLFILSAIALWSGASFAQSTVYGVTWVPPAAHDQAIATLAEIEASGARAIRMPARNVNAELLTMADSLGLELFLELSPGYLPAARLIDTLAAAQAELYSLAERVRGHESVTRIGLGRWSNTSDPTACVYFEEMAKRWTLAGERAVTYYTTAFLRDDLCSSSVDEVYVELTDHRPESLDSLYRVASGRIDNLSGIASVGTWVDPVGEHRGVRNERSPEWQARYLEKALASLLRPGGVPPAQYIFVHRWTDPVAIDDFFGDIRQRRYGIHAPAFRPAADILTGYATGRQQVFAFDPGKRTRFGWRWSTILGWVAIGALAAIFASSPQMRHMAPRYFLSHGFYREAVASGRESLALETIAVLAAVSSGVGLSLTILISEISLHPSFMAARNWMDPEHRDFFGALLVARWPLMMVLASVFLIVYVAWASLLSLLSRRARTLFPSQTLIVGVWTLWPLIGLLLVSPAIAASDAPWRLTLVTATVLVTAVVIIYATVRSLLDYRAIAGTSIGEAVIGLLLHPLTWASIAAGVLLTGRFAPEMGYFWDLIMRT